MFFLGGGLLIFRDYASFRKGIKKEKGKWRNRSTLFLRGANFHPLPTNCWNLKFLFSLFEKENHPNQSFIFSGVNILISYGARFAQAQLCETCQPWSLLSCFFFLSGWWRLDVLVRFIHAIFFNIEIIPGMIPSLLASKSGWHNLLAPLFLADLGQTTMLPPRKLTGPLKMDQFIFIFQPSSADMLFSGTVN